MHECGRLQGTYKYKYINDCSGYMMQRPSVRAQPRMDSHQYARERVRSLGGTQTNKQTNKPARSVLPASIGTALRHDTGRTRGRRQRATMRRYSCSDSRSPCPWHYYRHPYMPSIRPRIRMCQPAAKGGCDCWSAVCNCATCHLKTVFFVTTYLVRRTAARAGAARRTVPSDARRSLPGARALRRRCRAAFLGRRTAEHRRVRSLGWAALFIDGFTAAV
jgi:hypothetical protein